MLYKDYIHLNIIECWRCLIVKVIAQCSVLRIFLFQRNDSMKDHIYGTYMVRGHRNQLHRNCQFHASSDSSYVTTTYSGALYRPRGSDGSQTFV